MSDRMSRLIERASAEGLVDVAYAPVDSPVGQLTVAATDKGVVRVMFEREDRDRSLQEIADRVSPRMLEAPARLDTVRRELDEYFQGTRREFDLPLDWSMVVSPFKLAVLEHTATIPFGRIETYKQVATAAGNDRAMRAAGGALGSNPIPVVVPCHRVIGADGSLTGYGGGIEIKKYLLALEGAGQGGLF